MTRKVLIVLNTLMTLLSLVVVVKLVILPMMALNAASGMLGEPMERGFGIFEIVPIAFLATFAVTVIYMALAKPSRIAYALNLLVFLATAGIGVIGVVQLLAGSDAYRENIMTAAGVSLTMALLTAANAQVLRRLSGAAANGALVVAAE